MPSDEPGGELTAQTLTRCLVGDVPEAVLRALLSARLVGIVKAEGAHLLRFAQYLESCLGLQPKGS